MELVKRYVGKTFCFDTNRINSREKLEYMNQLEKWKKDGVILMGMSDVAQTEVIASRDEKMINKTFGYTFSIADKTSSTDKNLLREIEAILFPVGVKDQNQMNDVVIVFNAWKWSSILITADGGSKTQPGGILGNREKLKRLGIEVMTDRDAVLLVKKMIKDRDSLAIKINKDSGGELT
jgi:hypothetical protein